MKLGYSILATALGSSVLLHVVAIILFSDATPTKDFQNYQTDIVLTLLTHKTSESHPQEISVIGHSAPSIPPIRHPKNLVTTPTAVAQQRIHVPDSLTHLDQVTPTGDEKEPERQETIITTNWQTIQPTTLPKPARVPRVPSLKETEGPTGNLPRNPPKLSSTSRLRPVLDGEDLPPPPIPARSLQHNEPGKGKPATHLALPNTVSGETLLRILDRHENTAEYQSAELLNLPPSYPRRARREGLEGRVVLSVLVANTGSVNNIYVLETSGVSLLDEAAITAVAEWSFVPAKIKDTAVESTKLIPIRFQLED